ncbi:hypothetical protein HJG60_012150 [Phyllostomus discolor]|uniref:Uncharacterized protein n=1 Tax=Phyllostomus discolor TaxID=89673 RepID=A0A833ZLP7_9CHIR|nr:hypothetical protein HJG60_012150 [Phyllostomus discolor]
MPNLFRIMKERIQSTRRRCLVGARARWRRDTRSQRSRPGPGSLEPPPLQCSLSFPRVHSRARGSGSQRQCILGKVKTASSARGHRSWRRVTEGKKWDIFHPGWELSSTFHSRPEWFWRSSESCGL